jgi:endo-1,4-beta-D-glucanase Y/4-amino-4-deoxy-L-arabinose transferase-like glycosyltransferase
MNLPNLNTKLLIQKLQSSKFYNHLPLVLVLVVTIVTHLTNLFNYPYYENDEGIYQAQAWSIFNLNKLAPYTYWYDHAPGGWMILGLFNYAVGGFFRYNFSGFASLDTGRLIVFLMKLVTVFFIYKIIHNNTFNRFAASIGSLAFVVSPLAIYFQRRILLDNIMVFLFVLALYFITRRKVSLVDSIMSGILFAMAVLTKESAIVFIFGFIYLVFTQLSKARRVIGTFMWSSFSVGLILLYPLLAIYKTELFPSSDKVSLLGTLAFQAGRGNKVPFYLGNSEFRYNFDIWFRNDPVIMSYGIMVVIIGFGLSIFVRNNLIRAMSLYIFGMLYFLTRGGIVIDFYIVPIFPLIALQGGFVIHWLYELFLKSRIPTSIPYYNAIKIYVTSILVILISMLMMSTLPGQNILKVNENLPLKESLDYIRANIPNQSKVLIEFSHYLDLKNYRDKIDLFPDSDYFYKADSDTEIKDTKLKNDWKNIDYIVASHQLYKSAVDGTHPLLKSALDNSFLMADFAQKDYFKTKHDSKYYTIHGAWSSVFKVNNDPALMNSMWQTYQKQFVTKEGYTIDDYSKTTTSEGQSYSMLRSMWSDDKVNFDRIWKWTKSNLQIRKDSLFAWKYGLRNGSWQVLESESATDADLDIAMSLILANRRWGNNQYLEEAKKIINDIWINRVIKLGDRLALLPFGSNKFQGFDILNPSYFSPAHYRLFATIDPSRDWTSLANDTYLILKDLNKSHVLYPDWIKWDYKTSKFESASTFLNNPKSDNFSYDAMRVIWRIGMDWNYNKNKDAIDVLNLISAFMDKEYDRNPNISSGYSPSGKATEEYSTSSMDAMVSMCMQYTGSNNRESFWKDKVLNNTNYKEAKFKDNKGYYEQNLIWFAMARNLGVDKIDYK